MKKFILFLLITSLLISSCSDKSKEEKTSNSDKTNEQKTNEQKTNEEKTSEEKTNEEKTNEEKINEEKTNGEKTNEEKATSKKISKAEVLSTLKLDDEGLQINFIHAFETKYVSEAKKTNIFDDISDFEEKFKIELNKFEKALGDDELIGYFDKDYFYLNLDGETYVLTSFYDETIKQNLKNSDDILGYAIEVLEGDPLKNNTPNHTFLHDEDRSTTFFYILENDVDVIFHKNESGLFDNFDEDNIIKELKANKDEIISVHTPIPENGSYLRATLQKNDIKSKYFFSYDGYGAPVGIEIFWK